MIDISKEASRLDLYYKIRGAAINVQKNLGPFMVEKYYEKAMMIELASLGINAENQIKIPTFYKGQPLDLELLADIVVENEIIIELKATPRMEKSHIRQLLTYMKLMHKHYGLILNFGISYMSQYGMKAFVLSDFDEVVNSKGDFEDRVGVAVFS